MGIWDLLPLAVAGLILHITTVWIARRLLRRSKDDDKSARGDEQRSGSKRDEQRQAQASTANLLRAFKPATKAAPVAASALARRKAELQRKATAEAKPAAAPVAPTDDDSLATKQPIESLDFTQQLSLADLMPKAPVAEAPAAQPLGPTPVLGKQDAEEVGLTLVLDTAELMKSITGAAPPPPPPMPELTDAVLEPGAIDWTAALDGIDTFAGEAEQPAFFAAPQIGAKPLDLTQPVALSSTAGATREATRNALPVAPLAALPTPPDADDGAPLNEPAGWSEPRYALVQTSDSFRAIAIAHDDIQSARCAFEALGAARHGIADPMHRALMFGACSAYARPFIAKPGHPPLLDAEWTTFERREHADAHRELLMLRARLVDGADVRDDDIVTVEDGEETGDFAIRSNAFAPSRLQAYAAVCAALEARLLDRLSELAEPEGLAAAA